VRLSKYVVILEEKMVAFTDFILEKAMLHANINKHFIGGMHFPIDIDDNNTCIIASNLDNGVL